MNSDLLVIIPEGWKEMQTFWLDTSTSYNEVQGWIDNQDYIPLMSIAIEIGDIIPPQTITNAQMIRVAGENKIYIQVAG